MRFACYAAFDSSTNMWCFRQAVRALEISEGNYSAAGYEHDSSLSMNYLRYGSYRMRL